MLSFEMKPIFKSGTPLADAGLRGERKISCFANDTYHSLDGRFSVISRNVFVEQRLPSRLYPTHELYNPNYVELRIDGKIVARVRSLTVAINWIILKVRRYSGTGGNTARSPS